MAWGEGYSLSLSLSLSLVSQAFFKALFSTQKLKTQKFTKLILWIASPTLSPRNDGLFFKIFPQKFTKFTDFLIKFTTFHTFSLVFRSAQTDKKFISKEVL